MDKKPVAAVTVFGTRVYRAGVARGWQRADRMFSFEGAATLPARADVLADLPFWVRQESGGEYLDGFAAGFARRVSGCRADGSRRSVDV